MEEPCGAKAQTSSPWLFPLPSLPADSQQKGYMMTESEYRLEQVFLIWKGEEKKQDRQWTAKPSVCINTPVLSIVIAAWFVFSLTQDFNADREISFYKRRPRLSLSPSLVCVAEVLKSDMFWLLV